MIKFIKYIRKVLAVILSYGEAERKYGKKWYKSKTLWVNILALIVLFLDEKMGVKLSVEEQTSILAVINIILRIVTKEPIRW